MPSTKKIEIVQKLNEALKGAKALILTHYQGLTTLQLERLKKDVEKANAKMLVTKNTLLKVALRDLKMELPEEIFKGPTAIVLAVGEGLTALKSLVNFGKNTDGRPGIKLSFIEGRLYNSTESQTLASLPGREVLVAKFLGLLNSPLERLVMDLKSDQRKFVFILSKVAQKKV